MLDEDPSGGGDGGDTYDCECEDSPGPKVLDCLGRGGLHTGRG